MTRSEHLIHASKHDNFFIGFLLDGSALLSQDDHMADLRPGDIAILDSTRVYTIDVPSSFDALWVYTPRYRPEGRLHDISGVLASKIDGHVGIGRIASDMLRAALAEAPRLSSIEANRVANNMLDPAEAEAKWMEVIAALAGKVADAESQHLVRGHKH